MCDLINAVYDNILYKTQPRTDNERKMINESEKSVHFHSRIKVSTPEW